MHALDWLNGRRRILSGAFQPIEGLHLYRSRYRSRYRGLCDRSFMPTHLNLRSVTVSYASRIVHWVGRGRILFVCFYASNYSRIRFYFAQDAKVLSLVL